MSNKEYEWVQNINWTKHLIDNFHRDLDKLKSVQFNIFFTQKCKELVGYDKANQLMHNLRAFYGIISKISYNNAKEKNVDIIINASQYWQPAETTLIKIKSLCFKGEKVPFKPKLSKQIDRLLEIKRYIGNSDKLAVMKNKWLLNGLILIPLSLVIITMFTLAVTHVL